jgi:hypothetical protein
MGLQKVTVADYRERGFMRIKDDLYLFELNL